MAPIAVPSATEQGGRVNRMKLDAPFPYFGGKSRAASLTWARLGDVASYVEPFAGSLAILLGRPHDPHVETVNDLDGLLCNAWRAIAADPEATAHHADWPVSECDLTARHAYLVARRADLTNRLMGDPDFYDTKLAGWWLWGCGCWIGSGWCSGTGPWVVEDGKLVDSRQLPHLGDAGQGVNRGDALLPWFAALSERLRRVRICCGDWSRVLGDAVLWPSGSTCGVLLDPPYSHDERTTGLYAEDDDIADAVRIWAVANGEREGLRIALCGYEGEHAMPDTWRRVTWTASGGYSHQGDGSNRNKYREVVWFSPGCLVPDAELPLFAGLTPDV